MKILRTKKALEESFFQYRVNQKIIGLVPTMGALHAGHIFLVEKAKESSDVVLVSIFVNPNQFNNKLDYDNYPKTLDKDLSLLEKVGVKYVFIPEYSVLYPKPTTLILNFGALEHTMEGKYRPGHFNGVAIVVSKLLNFVEPQKAYFGQKDLQQVAVVKKLVQDLSFPVEIEVVPTQRETDGLAMSSRNFRLDKGERKLATILHRCLVFAKEELLAGKEWFGIKEKVFNKFQIEPNARLEYFELVETESLVVVGDIRRYNKSSVCMAAYIGDVRLIDNLSIID